ncbi:MAG: hypothetical protein PHY80_01605 [Rickettsiales bacterium]|nr:hypothetical protein [Rickettsiales bacterium]
MYNIFDTQSHILQGMTEENLFELCNHRYIPGNILKLIWQNIADCRVSPRIIAKIAGHPHTPVETLSEIWINRSTKKVKTYYKDGKNAIYNLAKNPNTSADVLLGIIKNRDKEDIVTSCTLVALTRNPNTPAELLAMMWNLKIDESEIEFDDSSDKGTTIENLVLHHNTPSDILSKIWNERNTATITDNTAIGVAMNPNTHPDILRSIWNNRATERYEIICEAITDLAVNSSTPTEILTDIWNYRNKEEIISTETLFYLAKNPNTNTGILINIWECRGEEKIISDVISSLARNPNTPIGILENIWEHRGETKITSDVISSLAKNPNTPIGILENIWKHRGETKITSDVISSLAKNPSTLTKILEDIWRCREDVKITDDVVFSLAENPGISDKILNDIWQYKSEVEFREQVISSLIRRKGIMPYDIAFYILVNKSELPLCLNPSSECFSPQLYGHYLGELRINFQHITPETEEVVNHLINNCLNIKKSLVAETNRKN